MSIFGIKYPASEKLESIRIVEQSHLPARKTLQQIGVPRTTFYRWYDRYTSGGLEALGDHPSRPDRIWNRIPDEVRQQIVDLALEQCELSPRELAVRFTDEKSYFVSEVNRPDFSRHLAVSVFARRRPTIVFRSLSFVRACETKRA